MKAIMVGAMLAVMLAACGGGEGDVAKVGDPTAQPPATLQIPEKSACSTTYPTPVDCVKK